MDARPNGSPVTVSSQNCTISGNALTNSKTATVACSAIKRSYGWPFIVHKTYTNVQTTEGIPLSVYQPSLHVDSSWTTSKWRISPNLVLAAGLMAVAVAILALLSGWSPSSKYKKSLHV